MIQRIHTGQIELAYTLDGPQDAPVICFGHCFTTDHGFWDETVTAFSDFRVLCFDARGHGDSDKPGGDYTLSMMAADVAGLLDALGIDTVHYAGVSMGGMIGQTLTIEYPDRVRTLTLAN